MVAQIVVKSRVIPSKGTSLTQFPDFTKQVGFAGVNNVLMETGSIHIALNKSP